MSTRERLVSNLAAVRARIASAAAGRPGRGDVTLVAVTKTVEPEVALELAALELEARGVAHLGESRAQELERKQGAFEAADVEVTWHFIGHLQRNKARRVAQRVDVLHSVDSLRLLETLGRLAEEEGRAPALFLQVKLSDEESKYGLAPDELAATLERARELSLRVEGLMTMAPFVESGDATAAATATFERLAALARTLPAEGFASGRPRLSMGMSGDFEAAVSAGADLVRVGSLLFEGLGPAPDDRATPRQEARR